jgi:cytochrome c biogenesis protein CcdA
MSALLEGTTVIAAFFAGMVALFAPCCISVMLPAYLATGVQRRTGLVATTFIFAAGVSTIILPIAFGVTAVSRLINTYHPIVYTAMALAMGVMGLFMVLGYRLSIPMPGLRAKPGEGAGRAYILGVFSGVATACCAPVLAGAIVLAGASANFVTTLGIGLAYVFGMVAPLFVAALVWDGRKMGQTKWLRAKAVKLSFAGRSRYVPVTSLAGGVLLVAMSVLTGITAVTGPSVPTSGWQVDMSSTMQHVGHVLTTWASHLPGWASALAVVVVLGLLARMAVRQAASRRSAAELSGTGELDEAEVEEGTKTEEMASPAEDCGTAPAAARTESTRLVPVSAGGPPKEED